MDSKNIIQNILNELKQSEDGKTKQLLSKYESTKILKWLNFDTYIFIEKFQYVLTNSIINLLTSLNLDKDSAYLLSQVQTKEKLSIKTIKNRRYYYMENELIKQGYFEEEQMHLRQPLLYKEYLGTYKKDFDLNEKLSQRILTNWDLNKADSRLKDLLDEMDDQMEEEEEEEEENMMEKDEDEDDEDKDLQRQELIRIMKERFIMGLDDYDYNKVDYDESLDRMDLIDQDKQQAYFSDEGV